MPEYLTDLPPGSIFWPGAIVPVPAPRLGTSQNVSYGAAGNAGTLSNQFGATTQLIQVGTRPSGTANGVRIAIGLSPSAISSSAFVPSGALVYYRVYPGEYLSVVSDDTNGGVLNVVECSSLVNPP